MQTLVPTMIHQCATMVRYLFGKDCAGRNLSVFPDDAFLVSYPRSGNTWFRFLVGNLISKDRPISFRTLERIIPDIHVNSTRYIDNIPRPRLLKSHEYFDPRYKKVVYIVRDPRDVAVSYYHYYRKVRVLEEGYPMDRYLRAFLTGELQTWGSWGENVASWLAARQGSDGFLLLRYEDLLDNPVQGLSKASDFLGIPSTLDDLSQSVDLSSAARMRELEKEQGDEWVTIKGSRKDVPFIGTATSGRWKAELTHDQVSAIESAWGRLMTELGYELSTRLQENERPRAVGSKSRAFDSQLASGKEPVQHLFGKGAIDCA